MLLDHGLLHGDALTITGQTVAEVLEQVPGRPPSGQEVIREWNNPIHPHGHLAILRGNLATEGAVAKIIGVKSPKITGPARVYDSEEACLEAIRPDPSAPAMLVIRYEGGGARACARVHQAIIGTGR
jgi:dihydroxy-acid dehydratase